MALRHVAHASVWTTEWARPTYRTVEYVSAGQTDQILVIQSCGAHASVGRSDLHPFTVLQITYESGGSTHFLICQLHVSRADWVCLPIFHSVAYVLVGRTECILTMIANVEHVLVGQTSHRTQDTCLTHWTDKAGALLNARAS